MRRILMIAVAGLMLAIGIAAGDSTVQPVSVTVTNTRGDVAGTLVSGTTYYRGQTLVFTNCVPYTGGTTSSAAQGLTNVTVLVNIGDGATSNTYTGAVNTAVSPNVWNLTITSFPTNWSSPYMQLKLTDSGNNSYIYPWLSIQTKAAM
jgi:hypothetical protein